MIATGVAVRQSWLNEMENEDVESWAKGKSDREVEELLKRIQEEMRIADEINVEGDQGTPKAFSKRNSILKAQFDKLKLVTGVVTEEVESDSSLD